ncbi:hypothetical protein OG836_26135 [Micromonospora zamorensis]
MTACPDAPSPACEIAEVWPWLVCHTHRTERLLAAEVEGVAR